MGEVLQFRKERSNAFKSALDAVGEEEKVNVVTGTISEEDALICANLVAELYCNCYLNCPNRLKEQMDSHQILGKMMRHAQNLFENLTPPEAS